MTISGITALCLLPEDDGERHLKGQIVGQPVIDVQLHLLVDGLKFPVFAQDNFFFLHVRCGDTIFRPFLWRMAVVEVDTDRLFGLDTRLVSHREKTAGGATTGVE